MKVLAIIGARSGSRGVVNKNILPILGKPTIAWTIESVLSSRSVDRLLVSTDSQVYADIAKKYGAQTPFLRPQEISSHTSHDIEYLTHALDWLQKNDTYKPDIVFKVSASCPLFRAEYFDKATEILTQREDLDAVYPIYKVDKHPYKMWKIDEKNHILEPFLPKDFTGFDEPYNMARQLLPKVYNHCGVFALRYNTVMKKHSTGGDRIGFFEIPPEDGFDIDNELDLHLAEILLKERGS